MDKYIGKYRVDIERDIGGDPVKEGFTYLRCLKRNKGGKVYRINSSTLNCYVVSSITKANSIYRDMCEAVINNYDEGTVLKSMDRVNIKRYSGEADIVFKEDDLDLFAEFIGLSISGANISPTSIKNHPRKDEIRAEKLENMTDEEKERRRIQSERLRQYQSFRKNKEN